MSYEIGTEVVLRDFQADGRIRAVECGRVVPDRTWRWKDEHDTPGATAIRKEGHRLIALAEARAAPFDGRWCDFRPDPSWRPTDLPWWWDLPRADRRVPQGC